MSTDDLAPAPYETHHLPCDVASVTQARVRLRGALEEAGAEERLVADAGAVVSELMMNALLHGAPDADDCVSAAWSVQATPAGHEVVVTVRDAGAGGTPRIEPADEYAEAGRGIRLVDALCDSWSVDHADGTAVTGRLSSGG